MNKRSKPMGFGHYTRCQICEGYGSFVKTRKASVSRLPDKREEEELVTCESCEGRGWIET